MQIVKRAIKPLENMPLLESILLKSFSFRRIMMLKNGFLKK